jgi:hypothetical protein
MGKAWRLLGSVMLLGNPQQGGFPVFVPGRFQSCEVSKCQGCKVQRRLCMQNFETLKL